MASYRIAGCDFSFDGLTIPELSLFGMKDTPQTAPQADSVPPALSCRATGWVGEAQREVEVWSAQNGTLLKVRGGSDFFISQDGSRISRKSISDLQEVTGLDREILLGPALVLALAQRGIWCLHASAVICKGRLIVFLGESGQGKSTLAAYLESLAADDILPVTSRSTVEAWPHFPQLKLQVQPGLKFPEHLPLDRICVLARAEPDELPELQPLAAGQAVQSILRYTAGARLLDAKLLASHLDFCARAGRQIPAYQLTYPHRKDTLAVVKELLESIC